MGVLARNYEKIYFRENVVETKNLPPYFPISLVRTKKKKNQFFGPQKKLTVNFFQKCTQLKLAPVPGSARNLRKSYRGIFEKTPYMYSMGVLADIVFFLDFSMVNHQHQSQGITGKPIPFFFFLASFFLQRLKNCFLPVFFDILVLIQSILDQFSKITIFSMEFEMCFSNVFSLAPEINDFFRCLRLWNFSTGGKATEWSTFLKTGPPKRTLL